MPQKTTRLRAAVLTLGLLALVAVAQAQSDPSHPSPTALTTEWTKSAVSGTVTSMDPQANTVTIQTDAGHTQSFLLMDKTWMRSSGKDITVSELKVGDRVRIDPTPDARPDEPTRAASRLEVVAAGDVQGSTVMPTGTSGQRTVSTDRPVLGESADAGDRPAMPATPGSTTGRTVSTDRPVFGQRSTPSTSGSAVAPSTTTPSTGSSTTTYGSTTTTPSTLTPPSSTTTPYGSTPTTPTTTMPSTPTPRADAEMNDQDEDELPATASPLPLIGLMGLLALAAGLAVRATRKQLS